MRLVHDNCCAPDMIGPEMGGDEGPEGEPAREFTSVPRPHSREELGGRIRIGRQAIFELRRLDRLARLQSEKTIDGADIVSAMGQHPLHRFDIGKRQGRRRIAATKRGC